MGANLGCGKKGARRIRGREGRLIGSLGSGPIRREKRLGWVGEVAEGEMGFGLRVLRLRDGSWGKE